MGFEISKSGLLAQYIKDDDTQDVVVPDKVNGIGKTAFKGIKGITSISLGEKIKKITVWGFIECSDLLNIYVSKNNPNFSSRDGVLYNKDGTVLLFVPQGRTEYVIPDGVIEVGDYACSRAGKLNKIVLPSSLKAIGKDAFLGCSFEQIVIPKSVESISDNAFKGCEELRSVRIDSKLEAISSYSFAFCKKLEEVNIPDSVKTIDIGAFDGCSSLKSVSIPASVQLVRSYAFDECDSLKSVSFANPETQMESYSFSEDILDEYTYIKPKGHSMGGIYKAISKPPMKMTISKDGILKKTVKNSLRRRVVIPDGVKEIANGVFSGCEYLESIEFPKSLTKIDTEAFAKCYRLNSVKFSDGLQIIGDSAFEKCDFELLEIPDGVVEIGNKAFCSNDNLRKLIIPESTQRIGEEAFSHCRALRKLFLNETIKEIGARAFYDCNYIDVIALPKSLKKIGEKAFGFKDNIDDSGWRWDPEPASTINPIYCHAKSAAEEYAIANGLDHKPYEEYAQDRFCVIRDGVLVDYVKEPGVVKVMIPNGVKIIGESSFEGRSILTDVIIPDSVRVIGKRAFYGCENLKNISISEGVESIEDNAFALCSQLERIVIPKSVRTIGAESFSSCRNLTTVYILNRSVTMDEAAFECCYRFEKPTYIDSVDEIISEIPDAVETDEKAMPVEASTEKEESESQSAGIKTEQDAEPIVNPDNTPAEVIEETIQPSPVETPQVNNEGEDDDQDEGEEYDGDGMITVCKYRVSKSGFEEYRSDSISYYKELIDDEDYSISQEEIDNNCQQIDQMYQESFALFEKLKNFLREMIEKYGQTYYTGNGSKGITITDDEITLIFRIPGFSDMFIDYPRLPNHDAFDKDDNIENLEEVFNWYARLDDSYPPQFPVAIAMTIGNKLMNDPVALMMLNVDSRIEDIDVSMNAEEVATLMDLMSQDFISETCREVEFHSSNTRLQFDEPQSEKIEKHGQVKEIKAKETMAPKPAKQPDKVIAPDKTVEPSPVEAPALVIQEPSEPTSIKAEASAPKASAAEYKPPVFPPRMSESEIENLFEFTDPFDDVNGKEFAVFADEVYYDPCIEYLKQNGAKVVLEPTEKTDYIIIEGRKQANDFEYAYKAGFKGKFTFMEEIRPHLTEEQRELYHYYEDVVGFEFDYEPKYDLGTSCELMYAVYDVVLGELTKCSTRPYGESIRYVTSITHYLGFSDPAHFDYSYSEMIDWIKGKETEEDFDKYEKLIYGMSFEDKLCAVMFALARYEWTGYEDDESMCDFAYKLTQKWFRKKEKPRLKEKIAQNVEYLRLKFKDIDRSENYKGQDRIKNLVRSEYYKDCGRKNFVPYVDLMRFEWAKDRLCVVARTDKKQKVLKSDVFSAQQGDVNLYVCYAAIPEKDEYYYLDNTQPFQWRMTPVEIWNAAKEKIVWLSKKEMPANIAGLIDTSISELEELGKNGRKKMLDKIKKQAAQLEKYTHNIEPESVPCFADLGAVIKELEENKAKIQLQADAVEAELRAVDSKLREAFDQQNAQVPSAVKKKDTEAEIARLTEEKSHLGFFKGKQKKALQAQIDELNAQLPQLDSSIAAEKQDQKAKYDPIITELGTQKSQLQQRLKELKDLIAEADRTIESLKF